MNNICSIENQPLIQTLNQINNKVIHDRDFNIFKFIKKKNPVIIDIGANRGQSIASFSTIFPKAQIHSFEANPCFFPILEELSNKNNLLKIYKHGLGSTNGTLKFYVPKIGNIYYLEEATVHFEMFDKPWVKQKYVEREVELEGKLSFDIIDVEIKCLDAIVIADPDIIKIDVEGSELDVLKGAERTLKKGKPILIIENSDWANVTEYLKNLKYNCYRLDPKTMRLVPMHGETTNCFYIKQDSRQIFEDGIFLLDGSYTNFMKSVFQQQLQNYGFNSFYINGYLQRRIEEMGVADAWNSAESLEQFCELAPSTAGFARYVLSTLWRGENIVKNLSSFLTNSHKRLLDVGCGFGGALIAFGKRGFDITGIELSPDRAAATEELLKDQNLCGCVLNVDVYSEVFDDIDGFDVILAENVIEHVDDPVKFLSRLSEWLNPQGLFYLEIPNRQGVQYVVSDPHYQLPFLTLLGHHSAKAAFNAKIGDFPYDVGEYYNLSWYISIIETLGFVVKCKAHPHATRTIDQFLELFVQITKKVTEINQIYADCDAFLRHDLKQAAWAYLADTADDYRNFLLGTNPEFTNRYLADAWIVIAQKTADTHI